jgi:acetyltransferase-like isoleucine patch superfamily enzyme
MPIEAYRDHQPELGERVYVDERALVLGRVELGDDVSIWPMAVVRGDVNFIRIGARSNIQDGTVVHVTHDGPYTPDGGIPTLVGEDVTVRVWDSTAETRYMVLPQRPAGTEGWSEDELASLVTRDALIGVATLAAPRGLDRAG